MAAVMNGLALHGGFIPYGGTFLTFSDYSRNAHPHGRADEAARDPRLHARLDRPRRGRADAPAGRARRQPAPDPEPRRLAARAMRPRPPWPGRRRCAARRAERAAAVAPGAAVARGRRSATTSHAAATCCASRGAKCRAAGHRLGGGAGARRTASCRRDGIAVRVVSMPSTHVFERKPWPGATTCCRRTCRCWRSRPATPRPAPVRRPRRRGGRHRALRRIGAWAAVDGALRLHGECGGACGTPRACTGRRAGLNRELYMQAILFDFDGTSSTPRRR